MQRRVSHDHPYQFRQGLRWWTFDFSSPDGTPLAQAYYPNARQYGLTLVAAGMSIGKDNVFCGPLTGRFLIRQVEYAANGDVVRLAIDAEQHCHGLDGALFAAIRYNSTIATDTFPGDTARYALNMSPPTHGVVIGSALAAGLACGGSQSACSVTFTGLSDATMTAIPDDGYMFTGWTGGCSGGPVTTVHVNSVIECGATFATVLPMTRRTLLILNSPPGDPVGDGRTYIYTPQNSHWDVTPSGTNGLSINVRSSGPFVDARWSLVFNAAPPEPLQVGQYNAPQRRLIADLPSLVIDGADGWGDETTCTHTFGVFVVHQIEFDPGTGEVTAFAADFQQNCGGGLLLWLTGAVNYRATFEIPCTMPDPFAALGEGVCVNGGWLPPGMPIPGEPVIPPPPPPPTGCMTPDPFTSLGGGTCANGGWFPPGMPVPGGSNPPPPPPPTGCTTPDPFVSLGGGTCRNGGWLPPGME
jgi:hypothetical protein